MAGHVFISYSRRDREYVDTLVAHLTANSIPVWFDDRIRLGSRWQTVIATQIDTCAAIVVVMTPDADTSIWVTNEIIHAMGRGKHILPLLLRGEMFFSLRHLNHEVVTGGRMPPPKFLATLRDIVAGASIQTADGEVPPAARAVGFELGTTTSKVCVLEDGKPIVIPNIQGATSTPSVVAFDRKGEGVVGEAALLRAVTHPGRTFRDVAREIGVDGTVDIGGRTLTAEQVAALILMKLKHDAEAYLGETIAEAVLVVPAASGRRQRDAAIQTGRLAGIMVSEVLSAPTAAGLALAMARPSTMQTLLVLRLGGGSFDASVVKTAKGVVEVVATAGRQPVGRRRLGCADRQLPVE